MSITSVSIVISMIFQIHDDVVEIFSALLALCEGKLLVTGEFPSQRPMTKSFDVFFYLRLNKRLSKRSGCWWFETPSCPLWHHCNVFAGSVSCYKQTMFERGRDVGNPLASLISFVSNVQLAFFVYISLYKNKGIQRIPVFHDLTLNNGKWAKLLFGDILLPIFILVFSPACR